jgi:hypothetical protein
LVHTTNTWLISEQIRGRAFSGKEVGPCETTFDDTFVDGVLNIKEANDCANRQNLGFNSASRHGVYVFTELFDNIEIHAGSRKHSLDAPLHWVSSFGRGNESGQSKREH